MEKPDLPLLARLRRGYVYDGGPALLRGADATVLKDRMSMIKEVRGDAYNAESCDEAATIILAEADRRQIKLSDPLCIFCGKPGTNLIDRARVFCVQDECSRKGRAELRRLIAIRDQSFTLAKNGPDHATRLKTRRSIQRRSEQRRQARMKR